jgi:FkbM family methyltransferase
VAERDHDIVHAIHPHWSGKLLLSKHDGSVVHEQLGSTGTYERANGTLTISWDKYDRDIFIDISGTYLHESLTRHLPEIEWLHLVRAAGKPLHASKIHLVLPLHDYEVCLRLGTSDIPTFIDTLVKCDFDSEWLPQSVETIVDLGGNIGLASVFFGLKYPAARILAVEPDQANFDLMVANTAALGERVSSVLAAVWSRDGFIDIRTEDDDGRPLGAWGIQVAEAPMVSAAKVRCLKLPTLLDDAGVGIVDILKVDIEGAELELFSEGAAGWLPRVRLIMVETHDRFRPGSDSAVRNAVRGLFEELPQSGENLIFRRR